MYYDTVIIQYIYTIVSIITDICICHRLERNNYKMSSLDRMDLEYYTYLNSTIIISNGVELRPWETSLYIQDDTEQPPVTERISDNIDFLESLSELTINNSSITEVPDELLYLTNLEKLDLSENDIIRVPLNLGELCNIINLDFSSNSIKELPESMSRMVALEELNLSCNQLINISIDYSSLTNLQSLKCTDNYIIVFPETNVDNDIEYIDLSNNLISSIPPSIENFCWLTYLNLNSNIIQEFPIHIVSLVCITTLFLDDNCIRVLPPQIGEFVGLKNLHIESNYIEIIPPEIGKLHSLEVLNLKNNNIKCIPDELKMLKNTRRFINLSNNPIDTLPVSLVGLTMTRIHLRNTRITSVPFVYLRHPYHKWYIDYGVRLEPFDFTHRRFIRLTPSELRKELVTLFIIMKLRDIPIEISDIIAEIIIRGIVDPVEQAKRYRNRERHESFDIIPYT